MRNLHKAVRCKVDYKRLPITSKKKLIVNSDRYLLPLLGAVLPSIARLNLQITRQKYDT